MMCVVGGDGEGTHKKQRATNSSAENYKPVYNHSGFEIPPRMLPQTLASLHTHTHFHFHSFLPYRAPPENCALWVGNINSKALTQSKLINLFQRSTNPVNVYTACLIVIIISFNHTDMAQCHLFECCMRSDVHSSTIADQSRQLML